MDYVLVEFPEVQKYMEEDWFEDEAVLHIDLASAYFIPKERIIDNDYILKEVKELCKQFKPTKSDIANYQTEREVAALPYEGGISILEAVTLINQEVK